jgi:hypothetical protein
MTGLNAPRFAENEGHAMIGGNSGIISDRDASQYQR